MHKHKNELEHLSSEQREDLIKEYYDNKNIQSLIEKYNIKVKTTKLYTLFPPKLIQDKYCVYCKSNMYLKYPPKNAKHRKEFICNVCTHKESLFGCKCKECDNIKNAERLKKDIEKSLYSKKNTKIKLNTREYTNAPLLNRLSLKDRAYLGAILRVHLRHDYLIIDLSYSSTQTFFFISENYAPTLEYKKFIIQKLLDHNIVAPYKLRNNEDKKILDIYNPNTLYDICINDIDIGKRDMLFQLMYPNQIIGNNKEKSDLLKEIHIYDAKEFLMITVKDFNLYSFELDKKYTELFSLILSHYSLSQLFNFIYSIVRNLAAERQRHPNRYIHMSDRIYKNIKQRYDKAKAGNWYVTPYNRSYKVKESQISQIVCNDLFNMHLSAFYQVV